MKECILCKGEAGAFAHKAYNGAICRKCRSFLPMHIDLKASDTDYLLPLYQRNKELAKRLETTCQYGELFLDTVHGLFCFSKGSKNGNPTHYGDVFSVTELIEVGVYMTDIKNIGQNSNKIVCNVKMRVKTKEVFMEYLVASSEACNFTQKGSKLDVTEPEKLTLFRNIFYQMIDDVQGRLLKKLEDIRKLKVYTDKLENTPQACELGWAKGVLFLENKEYSPEEIKKQYKELMRMFHPDLHPDFGDAYAQKLNKAYEILK